MRLKDIKEGYKKDHECKTPDAIYSSDIEPDNVTMSVKLPFTLSLDKEQAKELEAELHYAFEKVLSKYFD